MIAMNKIVDRDAAMYYTLDQHDSKDHVTLAEYLEKG